MEHVLTKVAMKQQSREICPRRAYSACERNNRSPENLFLPGCGKLKAIRVPANAKSWAGMKDWFGFPLVFDAKSGRKFPGEVRGRAVI